MWKRATRIRRVEVVYTVTAGVRGTSFGTGLEACEMDERLVWLMFTTVVTLHDMQWRIQCWSDIFLIWVTFLPTGVAP